MRPLAFFALGLVVFPAAAQSPAVVPVALYVDGGVSGKGPAMFEATAKASADLKVTRVTAADVRAGKLKDFRVLVMPGGSGSGQAKALEPAGRDAVKQFVKGGGCYVGICAGCYLASTGYDWSLDLLPAKVIDRAHWLRGTGNVKVEFTPDAKDWLKVSEPFAACRYANGPILEPLPGAKLTPLAYFREELVPKNGIPGVMINTPAVVAARHGKGWVLGVSPHPEQTDCLKQLVPSAVRWALAHP
ncbi:MAG: BPL-N domain-containing protein [Gemmataceae bacterium]